MTIFMSEAWHCQSSCAFIKSKIFKHPFVFHIKKTVIQVWNDMSKWWVNNVFFWGGGGGGGAISAPASRVNSIWLQMSLKCDVYDRMLCLCSYVTSDICFHFLSLLFGLHCSYVTSTAPSDLHHTFTPESLLFSSCSICLCFSSFL